MVGSSLQERSCQLDRAVVEITTCCMAAQCHSLCPAARAPSKISACQIGLTHPAGTTSVQPGTAFLSFGACLAMRMGHDIRFCTWRVPGVCITYSGCVFSIQSDIRTAEVLGTAMHA